MTDECKHERRTKKQYPHLAWCKDCGAKICPDCNGTGAGSWARCATCKGTGVIEEKENS